MTRLLCGWVALGLLVGGAAKATAQPSYVYTTIDVPGSVSTGVSGINDAGEMVGGYNDASRTHGFLLNAQGFTTIDLSGSHYTSPSGINNAGQIVGDYDNGGFLLSGGVYTTINPYAGCGSTHLGGINASGQIVGTVYYTSSFAFLISGGNVTELSIPYMEPSARGINTASQIVGSYYTMGRLFGYMLSGDSLTRLPDALEFPNGINDLGQVVGDDLLLSDGRLIPIDVPGSRETTAEGINNLGQIVGYYVDASGNNHGFLATPVPEPSTLLLLAIGTLGVIGWVWRTKMP